MPAVAPQSVQLNCPACGTPFRTAVYTLIDVSQQPELKQALLSGQLNMAVCPNCQTASMLGVPLFYHDADKHLCLVYFPQEMNTSPEEQERFLGDATTFVMQSLPPNAPRAHLLNPRRFLTLTSLLDAILEGDGISREMLEAQRHRVDLISELAGAIATGSGFSELVNAHRTELDEEFFTNLNAFIEATPPNQTESRMLLEAVRDYLAEELGGLDGSAAAEAELLEVIARLASVSEEELEETVAQLRGYIDYDLFDVWTQQIEAPELADNADEVARLTARRDRVVEIVADLDRQAHEMFEAGSQVLQTVISAEDPFAALHANADQVNEAFLMVLSANVGAAQRAGNDRAVEVLDRLAEEAVAIIQSRLSPQERFINELMLAETPQDATKLLRKNVAMITSDLVQQLNTLADQEEKRNNKAASDRLRQLARESGAMLF